MKLITSFHCAARQYLGCMYTRTWKLFLLTIIVASLTACASAPTVLTEVDHREVEVGVRTPLPDDCFENHFVAAHARMPAEGSLQFKKYVIWANALVVAAKRYRAQADRCRALNEGPDPAAPSVEP